MEPSILHVSIILESLGPSSSSSSVDRSSLGMEDSSEDDGEIVDCSTCEVVGIGDDYENGGGLGWILNTGLRWGKKAVITGIVLSSVPVVVPPLVVISALGFAASVPYGVVLASYVGTEMLMSKLLSPPALQSPEIGYETVLPEEEYEVKGQIRGVDEIMFELVENQGSGGVRDGAKVSLDVDDHDELNAGEERDESLLLQPREEEKQYLKMEEDIGGGSEATKMELRDNQDRALVEGQSDESPLEIEGGKNFTIMERRDKRLGVDNVEMKNDDDGKKDMEDKSSQLDLKEKSGSKDTGRKGNKRSLTALKFLGRKKEQEHDGKKQGGLFQKDEELMEETKISSEEQGRVTIVKETSKDEPNSVDSREKERADEVLVSDDVGIMERPLENKEQKLVGLKEIPNDGVQEESRDEMSQSRVSAKKDVGSIGKSIEKGSTDSKEMPDAVVRGKSKDEIQSVSIESEDVAEQEHAYSGVSTNNVAEASLEEEEIWKKMDAIRGIVGVKVPRQASYFEELKALYIFTGVEPPSSSSTDASEFNGRLGFLMTVIGLK